MNTLVLISIAIFTLALFIMSSMSGIKNSISALSQDQKWLLLLAMWSQLLMLPKMLEMTQEVWQWLPFLGMGGVAICGITNVLDKNEERIHMIAAIVSFICFVGWVLLINKYCLIALILCAVAGKEHLKWRAEVGLIISVYLTLILDIFSK